MKNSMCVKVVTVFKNPFTNRMTKVGELLNVSKGIFWFKRLADKDCELVKSKKGKVAPKSVAPISNNKKEKGSK